MAKLKKLNILILLLFLILFPRILAGKRSEKNAQEAVAKGDYFRAAEEYEYAARRLFWQADLWDETGKAKLFSGEKTEAITAFEKARAKGKLSAFGWDILGQNQWEQNNSEKALRIWQKGLLQHPAYYHFYTRFAMVYRENENYFSEETALKKRLEYESEKVDVAPLHYRLGLLLILSKPEEALDELTSASRVDEAYAPVVETLRASLNLALQEDDSAERQILLGRGLALVEEWQLAEQLFTNATQAQPKNASAWAWLGEAKQHLEQNPLPALDNALSLQENSVLVHSLRGLYWQRQNNFDEAVKEFQVASKLEPKNPNWQSALGENYANVGDLQSALRAYENATELAPKEPLYWRLLALFSVKYTLELEEIALPAAQKAVDLRPKSAACADTLGWVYSGLDRETDAEAHFLHALELDPNFGEAHLHLGMSYLKRNHLELAYQSLLRARELSAGTFVGEQANQLLDKYFQNKE